MFRTSDRREWAFLGLLVLGWGLVLGPTLHRAFTHASGEEHSHHHPGAPTAPHGEGSLEHGKAVFADAPVALTVALFVVAVSVVAVEVPLTPSLTAQYRTEQPQGP